MNDYNVLKNSSINPSLLVIIILFLNSVLSAEALPFFALKDNGVNSKISSVVKYTDLGLYHKAQGELDQWETDSLKGPQIWRSLFQGIVYVAKFNDLGNKKLLNKAQLSLKIAEDLSSTIDEPNDEIKFASALILIQKGFVSQSLGNSMSGMSDLRGGANDMEDLPYLEGKGFYYLYAYYLNQATSWIPFVSDDSKEYLKHLVMLSKQSPLFASLFANAAGWMHFDQKEYQKAMDLIKRFSLQKNQRVFHQMTADLLRKAGKLEEAQKVYVENRSKYKNSNALHCSRDLAAWANLALISKIKGQDEEAKQEMKQINDVLAQKGLELPPSLVTELENNDLL
jgi:tetratricopeptide (TPR) repeat protein